MHRVLPVMAAWAFVMAASPSGAASSQQAPPMQRAFEHYERIRAALAQDTTENVSAERPSRTQDATKTRVELDSVLRYGP